MANLNTKSIAMNLSTLGSVYYVHMYMMAVTLRVRYPAAKGYQTAGMVGELDLMVLSKIAKNNKKYLSPQTM